MAETFSLVVPTTSPHTRKRSNSLTSLAPKPVSSVTGSIKRRRGLAEADDNSALDSVDSTSTNTKAASANDPPTRKPKQQQQQRRQHQQQQQQQQQQRRRQRELKWRDHYEQLDESRHQNLANVYATEIIPHVYLGSRLAAIDDTWLQHHKITHILTVAAGLRPSYPKAYSYKVIRVRDHPFENLLEHFDATYSWIERALRANGNVLVHCVAGASRSASVVAAYLMKLERISFEKALERISQKRNIICPNAGFIRQLQLYNDMGFVSKKTSPKYWNFAARLYSKIILDVF